MTLYFITGSKHKFAEVKAVLPQVEQLDIDLPEIQELDAHKIIAAKLGEAIKHHPGPLMAEDTSLYIEGMNGLPGPLVKWFLKSLGEKGLVRMAQVFGGAVTVQTIIGYADERGEIQFFEGEVRGTLVEPRGTTEFGWDRTFLPEGFDITYGEMTQEQKNSMSHRGKALAKLKAYLEKTSR